MGPEMADMWISSDNGRGQLLSLSETPNQEHFNHVVGSWGVDVEAISTFGVEGLSDVNAGRLTVKQAEIVNGRLQHLMRPDYTRLRAILQHNQA
jgi:hypothetical protein